MYVLYDCVMPIRVRLMALMLVIAFVVLAGCQSAFGPTSVTPTAVAPEPSVPQREAAPKYVAPGESREQDEQAEVESGGAQVSVARLGSGEKERQNDDPLSPKALAQTSADGAVGTGTKTGAEALPMQPFHQPVGPVAGRTVQNAPSMGYANLSPQACRKQLRELNIPTKPARPVRSVATAVRLDGPLQGVSFRGPGPKSIFSTMDCRLVLALYEFAGVISHYGVVEVLYGNAYRPNAKLPRRKKGAGKPSQHSYGLAIDITGFVLHDGTRLMLPEDYHGEIGKPSCGAEAVMHEPNSSSIELRNLVCDVARKGVFHHMLTPNFNASHQDHFHFDIKRDGKWVVVR